MTKYVLNSGGLRNNPEKSREFFTELVKGLGNNPKILICCFAKPREYWEATFAEDMKFLPSLVPEEVSPALELAFPATFEKQIKNCDAIYIHGGDDHLLQYWLKKFSIPGIWEGKTIGTNSASSHALSKQFWTCDWRQCMEGIGTLPIKFLAHYKSQYGVEDPRGPINWESALEELRHYGDKNLPIHALEEGHYVVLEE